MSVPPAGKAFDSFTDDDAALLFPHILCRTYEKGELLLDRFASNETVSFVLSGEVDLVINGATLRTCGAGVNACLRGGYGRLT